MPSKLLAAWTEHCTLFESAEREFDRLPIEVQRAFLDASPEFSHHPWRKSATLNVAPLRDMPGRWRLKVKGGHRGTYRDLHGSPDFERFETRDEIYEKLRRYIASRG